MMIAMAGYLATLFLAEYLIDDRGLGGPLGYGSSVWEGQAAIAIRDQYLRYARNGFSIAAGRIGRITPGGVITLFAESFDLPGWFGEASPFAHTPGAPLDSVTASW